MRGSKDLTTRARALRRQATEVALVLWKYLRGRRFKGFKFRRQMIIGSYIVDFVCLEAMGYCVKRFWNNEILGELTNVLEQIRTALIEAPSS